MTAPATQGTPYGLAVIRQQARDECDSRRTGPYAEFMLGVRLGHRSGGQGSQKGNNIDRGPRLMEDLADHFAGLTLDELAGSWVAQVVDASMLGFRTAEVARALLVVAERLHGVRFPGVTGRMPRVLPKIVVPAAPEKPAPRMSANAPRKGSLKNPATDRRVKPIVHGRMSSYAGRGCRCDECAAVAAKYRRDYAQRKKGPQPP